MSKVNHALEDWERERAAWNLPRPKRPRNEAPRTTSPPRHKHRTPRARDEQSPKRTTQGVEEV